MISTTSMRCSRRAEEPHGRSGQRYEVALAAGGRLLDPTWQSILTFAMAYLQGLSDGNVHELDSSCVVGRSLGLANHPCALLVREGLLSAAHALLAWTSEDWEISDLGTSTGTLLNGSRLTPGLRRKVPHFSIIRFGNGQSWQLLGEEEPIARAESTSEKVRGSPSRLTLQLPAGDLLVELVDNRWKVRGSNRIVDSGAWLGTGAARFRFIAPSRPGVLPSLSGFDRSSRWDRHLDLEVGDFEGGCRVLMDSRAILDPSVAGYGPLLLLLARTKLGDPGDQGLRLAVGSLARSPAWASRTLIMSHLGLTLDELDATLFLLRHRAGDVVEEQEQRVRLHCDTLRLHYPAAGST